MRRSLSFLLLLLTPLLLSMACAATQATRPPGMPQPDINAHLVNPLFFGSTNSAAATIEVQVANRGTEPLKVRRIELDSPGMGQYTLQRMARYYNETIPGGQSKALTAFATAYAQTTRNPTEPLTIRVILELESGGKAWREIAFIRENL